jgi:hypothetical protein
MSFIRNYINYHKRKNLLLKIYEEENLIDNLSQLVGSTFKIDRAGRVYSIFNPFIKNGKFAYNEVIYEYNVAGTSFDSYVEKVLMEKLNVADKFILNHHLFDLVTYNIKKLDEQGNYLFTITPLFFDDTVRSGKKLLKWTAALSVILAIVGIVSVIVL